MRFILWEVPRSPCVFLAHEVWKAALPQAFFFTDDPAFLEAYSHLDAGAVEEGGVIAFFDQL